MAQNKVETDSLFRKLIAAVNNDDSKSILESCNSILQALPDDVDAQRCRIVCYINMEKYDDAIKVIDKSAHDFYNERIYCQYLKQNYSDALDLLNKRASDDNRSKMLRAQILYRMEKYEESLHIYETMTKSEDYDYLTNLSACYLLSNHLNEGASLLTQYNNSSSYELLYNYGTLLIYLGKLGDAESILQKSLALCHQKYGDGVDGDTVNAAATELDPIRVQLAYIRCATGDRSSGETLLEEVLSHQSSSKVVAAIATCNLVAARGCNDLADSAKRLKAIGGDVLQKLTPAQQSVLRFNRAVLLILLNRKKELEALLAEMTAEDAVSVAVLRVCDLLVRSREAEAVSTIREALQLHPLSTDLHLILLQTLINQSQFEQALEELSSLPAGLLLTPALQSLFFALCQHIENRSLVGKMITDLSSVAADVAEPDQASYLQTAAQYLFDSQQYDLAAEKFRTLLSLPSVDASQRIQLTGRLVLATARTDPEEAIRLSGQFPDVPIVAGVDMGELEDSLRRRDYLKRVAPTASVAALSPPTSPTMEAETEVPATVLENVRKLEADKKRKINAKKRAVKTAKYVMKLKSSGKFRDPKSLDAERWLAKEDRTVNKRRKRNQTSATGVGAQGDHVTLSEMDKFDAKKRSENPEVVQKVIVDRSAMRRKKVNRKGKK